MSAEQRENLEAILRQSAFPVDIDLNEQRRLLRELISAQPLPAHQAAGQSVAGGTLGIAVLATPATSCTDHLLAAGANRVESLLSGFHLAFITSVALVAAGIVLGAVALRGFGRWTGPCICTTATI